MMFLKRDRTAQQRESLLKADLAIEKLSLCTNDLQSLAKIGSIGLVFILLLLMIGFLSGFLVGNWLA